MDLRVEKPCISDEFVAALKHHGIALPVRLSDEDVGVVLDASGAEVLVVDANAERKEQDATGIAAMIVVALNTCGGFRAEQQR